MKTRTKTKKDFDAVELMRGMAFTREKGYFKKGAERARKYKPVDNRR